MPRGIAGREPLIIKLYFAARMFRLRTDFRDIAVRFPQTPCLRGQLSPIIIIDRDPVPILPLAYLAMSKRAIVQGQCALHRETIEHDLCGGALAS